MVFYTAAGCLSATFIGALLGTIGRQLGGSPRGGMGFYAIALLALVLAASDLGLVNVCLPERKRQTEKIWAHKFGFPMASAMWGMHIGLGFGTRITYGGFWVLVALALGVGDPTYGALLMMSYWLGRTLPVWIAPSLLRSVSDVMKLPGEICADRVLYGRLAAAAAAWSSAVALLLALRAQVPLSLPLITP